MSEQKSAEKIIQDLYSHHKNSDNRLQNMERQLDDLKKATRIIQERSAVGFDTGSDDTGLADYIEKDGSVRLTKSQSIIKTMEGDRPVEKEGLLDASSPSCDWHEGLIRLVSERQIIRMAQHVPYTPKYDVKINRHLSKSPRSFKPAIQRVFNDSAGVGAGWIPDQFLPDLWSVYEVPRGLRALFNEVEVDKNTVLIPRINNGGRPYIKGKLTQDDPLSKYTASTVTTAQSSISVPGLATLYNIDDAAAEDSLIPALPTLSRQIASDLTDAFEDCMINGDTATPHEDAIASWNIRGRWGASGLGGASDHRRAFMGLRAYALDIGADASTALGTLTAYSNFLALQFKLGELGVGDMVCVVSPEVYLNYILGLTEVKTVSDYGAAATIVTGEVSKIGGIPIVISRFMGADMETSGLFTGGGGARSGMLIINHSAWNVYMRRGILVEQDKQIASGAIQLVSTMRATFASPAAASTVSVVYGYNLP